MEKHYTIGEIFRLQLITNLSGKPYTSKATVSKVLRSVKHKKEKTPWGVAKVYSETDLLEFQKKNTL